MSQDNSSIFITSAWQQQIDLVMRLSQRPNHVLVIGPPQAGKSTFLKHLMHISSENKYLVNGASSEALFMEQVNQAVFDQKKESLDLQLDLPLLLVDDAHLLNNQQLQTLFQLKQIQERCCDLVLVGEPSLELRLFSPEFSAHSSSIYTIELEPWTQEDVEAFLMSKGFALSTSELENFCTRSQGLPGYVIEEKLMLEELFQTGKKVVKDHKRKIMHPIVIGIVMGALMGSTYLLFNNNEEENKIPTNVAHQQEEWQLQASLPSSVAFQFDKPHSPNASVKKENVTAQTKKEALSVQKSPDQLEKATFATKIKHPLLAVNQHHYTLQLVGARKEQNVKNFIQRHALVDKAYYFQTKLSDQDWYVVVYGDYTTKEQAQAALRTIPAPLQKESQPWVREMQAIQREIRQAE